MAKCELSNEIRRLRFEHGEMTQQDLADRVKVTRQTIIARRPAATFRPCCWLFASPASLTSPWTTFSIGMASVRSRPACDR